MVASYVPNKSTKFILPSIKGESNNTFHRKKCLISFDLPYIILYFWWTLVIWQKLSVLIFLVLDSYLRESIIWSIHLFAFIVGCVKAQWYGSHSWMNCEFLNSITYMLYILYPMPVINEDKSYNCRWNNVKVYVSRINKDL